ncbi:MAG: sulfite exporter TauE/SafE family protein [Betaproteobacteria bacterium]
MLPAWPFITDPFFYALAVPAVLITGLSKSGFASGFGALATPLLALAVPAPQAAAVMLPLLIAMDATGVQQMWRHRDRVLVRRLVPWGVVGIDIGTLLIGVLSDRAVAGVLGALTLLFLAQRLLFPIRRDGRPPPAWAAPLCSATSGFTSFVAHAGGPPLMAYVLPLKLAPMVASATMAAYFTAINLVKLVPYAALGLMDLRNLATSLLLLPLAPVGVWLGVRLVERTDPTWFYRLAYVGMAVAGVKLLWDGLGG